MADHARHGRVLRLPVGAAGDLALGRAWAPAPGTRSSSLTLVFIPPICRVSESVTTQVRGLDFVEAARASGAGALTIVRVHVLGNVLGPILVYATRLISVAIILAAGLSLPRPRRQAARAGMGPDAEHAAPGDLGQPGPRRAARRDDLHHLDLLQPDERRPARGHGREGLTWTRCSHRGSRRPGPAAAAGDRPAQALPGRRRPARPQPQGRARGRRSHAVGGQGRDPRRRRRIGLRQVDDGAAADPPDQARHAARWCFDGDPVDEPHGITRERAAPPGADGVPGHLRLAQSAPHRSPRRIAFAPKAHGLPAAEARARARDLLAQGRPRARQLRRPLSARAVGRPAPARQHRPRAGAAAAAGDPRRGGVGARQVGRGAGAEPAGRPQERASASPTSSSPTISTSCSISATACW